VLAGRDVGAPHLQDTQPTSVDRAVCFVLELKNPVGDCELRPGRRLRCGVLADHDQHRVAVRDLAREVVDRATKLVRLHDVVQRLAAVDHDDHGLRLEAAAQDLVGGGLKTAVPVAADLSREVEELDSIAERVELEEAERLEMPDHLVVRLRPRRVVDGLPLGGRVREAHLLGEDRLPAARRPRENDQRTDR
jgi:hypothetical protein